MIKINKLMQNFRVIAKIRPGLQEAVGKPVFAKNNNMTIGKIIEYDIETGTCEIEINADQYDEIMKTDFQVASRGPGSILDPEN